MDIELTVERIAVGGDAIAHEPSGRVVFVSGALPGERVRASVVSRGRDFWRARTVEVLEAAPGRVEPSCSEVARGCGGCGWQYVAPEEQRSLKVAIVRDALARQGRLPGAEVRGGASLPPLGYRTTVRAGVTADGRLGLRRAASNEVLPLAACPVAHPALSTLFGAVRAPQADEVVVRVSEATGERTLVVHAASDKRVRLGGVPQGVSVGGQERLTEMVEGQQLQVSAGSFFQSSGHSAVLLVDAVRRAVGDPSGISRWADLYSGIGLFAATLFRDVPVVTVEMSSSSVADARLNLVGREALVIEGDVEAWDAERVDLVVADPSRSGLGRNAVSVIARTGAQVLVLVSCDAASLGRDAALLVAAGYRHAGSEVLDLFPQTPHVEVVTRFERVAG